MMCTNKKKILWMIWLFFMEGPKGPFGWGDYCGDGKWGREVGRKCYGIVFGWGGENGRENGEEKRGLDWKLPAYPLRLPIVFNVGLFLFLFIYFSNLTFSLSIYLFLLIYIDSIFFLLNFIYINLIAINEVFTVLNDFHCLLEFSYSYIYRGSIDFYYLAYNLKAWIQPKVL